MALFDRMQAASLSIDITTPTGSASTLSASTLLAASPLSDAPLAQLLSGPITATPIASGLHLLLPARSGAGAADSQVAATVNGVRDYVVPRLGRLVSAARCRAGHSSHCSRRTGVLSATRVMAHTPCPSCAAPSPLPDPTVCDAECWCIEI